jgi:hypothetical protein
MVFHAKSLNERARHCYHEERIMIPTPKKHCTTNCHASEGLPTNGYDTFKQMGAEARRAVKVAQDIKKGFGTGI